MQTNHSEDSCRLCCLVVVADKPPKAMKRGIHKTRYVDMCGLGIYLSIYLFIYYVYVVF